MVQSVYSNVEVQYHQVLLSWYLPTPRLLFFGLISILDGYLMRLLLR
jgi:hypothetical protein